MFSLIRDSPFFIKITKGSFCFAKTGGPEETRTPDLRTASAALYQLSYGPLLRFCKKSFEGQALLFS